MDHPMHRQIVGTLEGPSTVFTDIIPLIYEEKIVVCFPFRNRFP